MTDHARKVMVTSAYPCVFTGDLAEPAMQAMRDPKIKEAARLLNTAILEKIAEQGGAIGSIAQQELDREA